MSFSYPFGYSEMGKAVVTLLWSCSESSARKETGFQLEEGETKARMEMKQNFHRVILLCCAAEGHVVWEHIEASWATASSGYMHSHVPSL